jgi:membrane protease YdiL (CAAX protease family)
MPANDARRRVVAFLVLTFALSSIFYVLVNRNGGMEGNGGIFIVLLMWMPGIAAIMVTFAFQRNLRGMGWGLGRPIYYAIAYALPLVYGTAIYGTIWLLGLGGINTAALGENFWLSLLFTLTVGVIVALIFAVGEEIGWRGLLVPQLARFQPFVQTSLISGTVWGLWHLPLVVTGVYTSGTPAWFAISCFMVGIIAGSFVYAWLRLESGSLWPAALLHAVHNTVIQSVFDEITIDTGNTLYFSTEFGLFLALVGLILAFIVWRISISSAKHKPAGVATAAP